MMEEVVSRHRQEAIQIWQAGVTAVQPAQLMAQYLRVEGHELTIGKQKIAISDRKNIYVIGAGKAAAAMAVAVENSLGEHCTGGMVTTKYGHALQTKKVIIHEAAHPVPDHNSVQAVAETLQWLKKATSEDLIICLISGGASALWCDVPPGATLAEVQQTFDLLLRSGADITAVNTIRKHLSAVKGGQLLRHTNGAKVYSLIISDVPGDNLSVIASGPTVPDASTFQEARDILDRYQLWAKVPHPIREHIESGMQGATPETLKPGDPLFEKVSNHIIGSNTIALEAAAAKARDLGYQTDIRPQYITGEAETVAKELCEKAGQHTGARPYCLLQGGETTVKVTGKGKGGRNQQLALAALIEMQQVTKQKTNNTHLTILSAGTDGSDGPTDAAGAIADERTIRAAISQQLNPTDYLRNNDAYQFFQQTDSLLVTGPTQTNVMDIMLALVY